MKSKTLEKFIEYCEMNGLQFPDDKRTLINNFFKEQNIRDRHKQKARNLYNLVAYRKIEEDLKKDRENIIEIITDYFEQNVKEWK